ncbi:MAG: penicillin acylase family protein [Desulfamplus sp.]|nr:penicillin acylase family protein [Desulfamplus sp.]
MRKTQKVIVLMIVFFNLFITVNAIADNNCISINQDLSFYVPCAKYGDVSFNFTLKPYKNPNSDIQSDFFWKLDSFLIMESSQTALEQACKAPFVVPSDLVLAIDCANYYGTHLKFKLLPYDKTTSNAELLWKLDMGSLELLNLPVTTSRDDKGVWFITGDDKTDTYTVFESMGYAVATDRLWQAEKYRRVGRGKLAEIFGKSQLASDIKVRTTGYSDEEYQQGFNALDPESKSAINGYVAGFNRRIAEVKSDRSKLPFEFHALGKQLGIDFVPEDWTTTDVLAWATNMLRFFDGEATEQGQIQNLALMQKLKAQFPNYYLTMFQDLRWQDDPDAVTYIEKTTGTDVSSTNKNTSIYANNIDQSCDFQEIAVQMEKKNEEIVANLKDINAYVKIGSYAWVVSGAKTASGNPILYSGPQMDHAFNFSVPSIVTEGSIKGAGLNISGMTIPGMPAIVIGRTPHHAWSMQVGHAHTLDYYIEDPSAIFLHRTETIKVAGETDVQLPIYRTSHGPVINSEPVISWKYSHWGKEFEIVKTYLDLARAQSMDQFGAAIDKVSLSQHYCYADKEGNIAYWMSGFDPIRPEGIDSRFPQPGDGTAEWSDPVVYKPRSHSRNAKRGFYSGWNSRSSHDYMDSSNTPTYYFGPFHRAHVLEDYLSTHEKLTFEDVRNLAMYISTTDSVRNEYLSSKFETYGDGGNPWKYVKADFIPAVESAKTDARINAISLLNEWDGHFVDGGESNWANGNDRSDAWILMNQWISEVLRLTFEDELGVTENRIVLFNVLLHGLPKLNSTIKNNYNWFENKVDTTAPQKLDAIIVAALDNALKKLGEMPWGTDKRGNISYKHEMLGVLHQIPTSSRSTYAHCVEMGSSGPVRIESMIPLGESGNILMGADGKPQFDPNFFSMSDVYDGFQHRDFPLNP